MECILLIGRLQQRTEKLKKEIESVNLVRKSMQLENGPKLKTLARKWGELVYKNNTIEVRLFMHVCVQYVMHFSLFSVV